MGFTTDDSGCVHYTSEPQCKCKCSEKGQPDVEAVQDGRLTASDPWGSNVSHQDPLHPHVDNVASGDMEVEFRRGRRRRGSVTTDDYARAYLLAVVADGDAWPSDRIKAAALLLDS